MIQTTYILQTCPYFMKMCTRQNPERCIHAQGDVTFSHLGVRIAAYSKSFIGWRTSLRKIQKLFNLLNVAETQPIQVKGMNGVCDAPTTE